MHLKEALSEARNPMALATCVRANAVMGNDGMKGIKGFLSEHDLRGLPDPAECMGALGVLQELGVLLSVQPAPGRFLGSVTSIEERLTSSAAL
jgi:hypothetical protein